MGADTDIEGWRPIETAPRDGTHISVWGPHCMQCTVHWFDGGWHLSVNQRGEFSAYVWGEPTHWAPLLPDPKPTPREHTISRDCWCGPTVEYFDPDTGVAVLVHKQTQ